MTLLRYIYLVISISWYVMIDFHNFYYDELLRSSCSEKQLHEHTKQYHEVENLYWLTFEILWNTFVNTG